VLAFAAFAAPAAANRRPDLKVPSASLTSKDHVFLGDDGAFVEFTARTKNVGKKVAPATKTRLLFARKPDASRGLFNGPTVRVPRLAPGESDRSGKSSVGVTALIPMGSYYVIVCADEPNDVVESDEDNNCTYTGRRFDVIARKWSGYVRGRQPLGYDFDVRETWSAPDGLDFIFDRGAGGTYYYVPRGTLHYKVSGSSSGPGQSCTYTGSGDYDVTGKGDLEVSRGSAVYSGPYGGGGSGSAAYTVTQTCVTPYGTFTNTQPSPQNAAWFFTNQQTYFFDQGTPTLADSYTLSGSGQPVHWEWHLEGEG
jgi:hypothetical protein